MIKKNNLSCFILFICLAAILCGCGRKKWPQPAESESHFRLVETEAARQGQCLHLNVLVRGPIENLSHLVLEIAPMDEQNCAGCPFVPRARFEYAPGSSGVRFSENSAYIAQCGLDENLPYRYRLLGYNVFDTIEPIITPVRLAQ